MAAVADDGMAFDWQPDPWDNWETIASGYADRWASEDKTSARPSCSVDEGGVPAMPCVVPDERGPGEATVGNVGERTRDTFVERFAAAARNELNGNREYQHREKNARSPLYFNAMVARPVGKEEIVRVCLKLPPL
jgi:hypothetical protein